MSNYRSTNQPFRAAKSQKRLLTPQKAGSDWERWSGRRRKNLSGIRAKKKRGRQTERKHCSTGEANWRHWRHLGVSEQKPQRRDTVSRARTQWDHFPAKNSCMLTPSADTHSVARRRRQNLNLLLSFWSFFGVW